MEKYIESSIDYKITVSSEENYENSIQNIRNKNFNCWKTAEKVPEFTFEIAFEKNYISAIEIG